MSDFCDLYYNAIFLFIHHETKSISLGAPVIVLIV